MADEASRAVQGGAAQPVFVVNNNMPTTPTTPPASQNVVVTSQPAPPTGANATQVQGNVAAGSAIAGNPVRMAGSDGTNVVPLHGYPSAQAGQNFEYVGGAFLSVSASTSVVAPIGTTDVANFNWVSVHITASGTNSTATFQCVNDLTATWVSNPLESSAATQTVTVASAAATGVYHGPLMGRYFRINVTGITALTTSVVVVFSTLPRVLHAYGVSANLNAIGTASIGAADAKAASSNLNATPQLYNGTNTDMQRNNHEVIPLASAARTALVNSIDQINYNHKGVVVTIDVTVYTAGSLTVSITGKSTLANAYRTILTSAAITGTGRTILKVYPGLTPVANLTVNDVLERLWRVEVAVGSADSITYSVSANYVA